MTSITLNITGARIQAAVNGPLTSGMAGIPVTIRYDNAWNGLTKNLVCRCGKWGPDKGDTRTVLNIGETATVAHEVMRADMHLYLGIEGYSADGKLVIPTTWADCGKIQYGAHTGADLSANPKLSVWAQLQAQIEQIKQKSIAEEEIAAAVAAYMEENPIEIPDFSQNGVGLSNTAKTLLITILRNGAYGTDQSAKITALEAELASSGSSGGGEVEPEEPIIPDEPDTEKTLTSIFAMYSGGSVLVGTPASALTDIVVTAYYSDGTSEAVTGYTLSGTIAEGSNIVTVSYGGKTTTFTVTGVAVDVSAYQEVEYIEFDGNSFIATNAVAADNFRFEGEVSFPQAESEGTIICMASGTAGFLNVGVPNTADSIFWYVSGNGMGTIADVTGLNTSKAKFIATYNREVGRSLTVEVNGETYSTDGTAGYNPTSSNLKVTVGSSGYSSCRYGYVGKIYSLAYYMDNVLTCDLMPCYRKADGVIGMYDRVHGKFYANNGTGTFAKGADVA